jgi:heme-degrading monooxygenase HmoA
MRLALRPCDVHTPETFVALVIYPSSPSAQVSQADSLLDIAAAKIRTAPGFIGGRVFLSEDGESIVSLVEWRDRESFAQFRQTESGRDATLLVGGLQPRPYWLRPHAIVER